MGIIIGIFPALFWGCVTPFSSKIGGKPRNQTLGITLGAFCIAVICGIVGMTAFGITYAGTAGVLTFFIALVSGLFWYIGSYFQFAAIKRSTVSKTIPVAGSGQLLSVTIASAFIFKNWLKEPSSQLPLGFALLLIIVIGVVLTSLSPIQKTNTKVIHGKTIVTINEQSKSNNLKFWLFCFISTAGYFIYFIIPEAWTNISSSIGMSNPNSLPKDSSTIKIIFAGDNGNNLPQALGMVLAASSVCLVSWIKTGRKNKIEFVEGTTYKNMIPGLFQGAGNLFFIISALINGTAIAAPLNQLNIIVGTLLGIFLLKEKKQYPYGIITYIGLILITFGALSIGFMNQILKIN